MTLLPTLVVTALLACGDAKIADSGRPAAGTPGPATGATGTPTGATTPTGGTAAGTPTPPDPLGCNGHVALCDRPVDQVAFATTHNGHASLDAGFTVFNANHEVGLAAQLGAGVRGVLLDVYEDGGELALCHGPCALGRIPHRTALDALVGFLEDHPREVVILLYEDYVTPAALADEFDASGASRFAYAHPGGPWPTLGALIDAGTPLIVTAQSGSAPPAWLHNFWDVGFDTPYSFDSLDAMSCDLNRGSSDNALFLVNHWLSTPIGLPDRDAAPTTNSADVLEARVRECEAMWGRPANLVAVDWHETGDLFAVVNRLNGL